MSFKSKMNITSKLSDKIYSDGFCRIFILSIPFKNCKFVGIGLRSMKFADLLFELGSDTMLMKNQLHLRRGSYGLKLKKTGIY